MVKATRNAWLKSDEKISLQKKLMIKYLPTISISLL